MNEIPLYNGAVPQAPQVQLPQVPEMPHVQGNGEMINRAIDQVTDVVHRYAQLRDFGVRQQVEHRQRELDLQMQQDFERRAELPWGAEGSFFSADGQLDDDAVAAFTQSWQQKNNDLPDGYWLTENAMRSDAERQARNDQMVSRVTLQLLDRESKNRAQAFKDNFDLALAQGDSLGACRIVDDAVASGQVTPARGQLMKLSAAKMGVAAAARASGGSTRGGGSGDYSLSLLESLVDAEPADAKHGQQGSPYVEGMQTKAMNHDEGEAKAGLPDAGDAAASGDVSQQSVSPVTADIGPDPVDVTADDGLDLRLGVPGVVETIRSMSPDEFSTELSFAMGQAGRPMLLRDRTGAAGLVTNAGSHEVMQAMAHESAQRHELPSVEDFRKGVLAVSLDYVFNPAYAGLTKQQMFEMVEQDCFVDGLAESFFPQERNPELAFKSMLQEAFSQVWDTKDAAIEERVQRAMQSREGLPGIDAQVQSIPQTQFTQRVGFSAAEAALNSLEYGFFDNTAKKKAKVKPVQGLLDAYWSDFVRETGIDVGDNVPRAQRDNIEKFREWYYKPGGVYTKRQEDYAAYARQYLKLCAVEAVANYRRDGGNDWAEENTVISSAITKGMQQLDGSGSEISRWRDSYRANMATAAKLAAQEAASFRKQVKPLQDEAAAEKAQEAARKEAEKLKADREAEQSAWEEEAAKAARKKAWKERKQAEYEREHPYAGAVNVSISFADDGDDVPCLTVPPQEYERIREQLAAGDGDGIAVKFAGSTKALVVKAGAKGSSQATFNHAAFLYLYGKNRRLKPADLKRLVNPHSQELRFVIAAPNAF